MCNTAQYQLAKAAELVEQSVDETLTYYRFPEQHWRRIRTNNPLETELFTSNWGNALI
jgi:transposase-like protein